jgi:phosphotriesterase-related protein
MSKIETVRGPISPDDLGFTLMHDHVLIDVTVSYREPKDKTIKEKVTFKPITMENLGILRRCLHFSVENLKLNDEGLAVKELNEYKAKGGVSIVDQTIDGAGRDVAGLKRISEATGVHIIAVCGWYRYAAHPTFIRKLDVETLSEIMVAELTEGIGQTGIKAGMIGECACSQNEDRTAPWFHDDEKKIQLAGARAQRKTGASFTYHTAPWEAGYEPFLDLIRQEEADMERFMLSHCDPTLDLNYLESLMGEGITLSFDTFGMEYYYDYALKAVSDWQGFKPGASAAGHDLKYVETVVKLCELGYDKNIVLSQDICHRTELKTYGGWGYTHLIENIVPWLEYEGVTPKQIHNMFVENPKRLLVY